MLIPTSCILRFVHEPKQIPCKANTLNELLFKKVQMRRNGEIFDRSRHSCGTEIKAITYSAMQINEATSEGDTEIFVIVDI